MSNKKYIGSPVSSDFKGFLKKTYPDSDSMIPEQQTQLEIAFAAGYIKGALYLTKEKRNPAIVCAEVFEYVTDLAKALYEKERREV